MADLSKLEQELLRFHREGRGILWNADLGFLVRIDEQEDGRLSIQMDDLSTRPILGPAEAQFVGEAIKSLQSALVTYEAKHSTKH